MNTTPVPLATYTDKSAFGVRSYELFSDRVVVNASSPLVSQINVVINLSTLSPDYATISVTNPFLWMGVSFMAVGWMSYAVISEIVRVSAESTAINFLLALGFMGLGIALISLKKQRLARFHTQAGIPSLDIFSHGPRKNEFQGFIDRLQQGIRDQPRSG